MLLRHSAQFELATVGEDGLVSEVFFSAEAVLVLVLDHEFVKDVFVMLFFEIGLHEMQLVF